MAGSFADSRRIHAWRGIDTCILEQLIMEADQKAYADAMSNGLSNQSRWFPLRQNPPEHPSRNNKLARALQHKRTVVTLSPISVHVTFSSTRSRLWLVWGRATQGDKQCS
jgi:hypothetical protein